MGCLSSFGMPGEEDKNKLVRKEAKRTDIKLIENAENIQGIQLVKLKPANKKKWSFPNKKFTPLNQRKKIQLTVIESKEVVFIDLKDNTYGINYSNYYIDVHDVETQNFLYRIKPIDGGQSLHLFALRDGTFLYRGDNKCYIISILEKKAYQIHYEIDKIYQFLQLCDERILSFSYPRDCIYEKDSEGKFKKILEKDLPSFKSIIQIRDNVLLGRDSSCISFIDANTLEITDTIHYSVWNEYASQIGMISENLCVIKNKETNREYALIDLNKKKIIDYTSDYEQERIEYYKIHPYETPVRRDIMVTALPLPDGSIFCKSFLGDWTYSTNCIIYWDSNDKQIKSRSLIYENDERNHQLETEILKIFENGYVIVVLITQDGYRRPFKYYLLK